MKEIITNETVPTTIDVSLREFIEAWLDGNKPKMREIQNRNEIAKARRKLLKVIRQ